MYKKLDIDFKLPEMLEDAIDRFLYHINHEDGNCEDCYRDEINFFLKECMDTHSITSEQIELLREYYVWRGIYHVGSSDWLYKLQEGI